MPNGLGAELASLGQGKGFAEALTNIGEMIRRRNLEEEANKELTKITGIDMTSKDAMSQVRNAILRLGQLGEPGQQAIKTTEAAEKLPIQIEQEQLASFQNEMAPVQAQINDYTANIDKRTKETNLGLYRRLHSTAAMIEQKYPALAGRVTSTIPEPREMGEGERTKIELDKARIRALSDKAEIDRQKLTLEQETKEAEAAFKQAEKDGKWKDALDKNARNIRNYQDWLTKARTLASIYEAGTPERNQAESDIALMERELIRLQQLQDLYESRIREEAPSGGTPTPAPKAKKQLKSLQ